MTDLKRKINKVFYQVTAVSLFFTALFVYLIIMLYDKLRILWASFMGRLETICGCPNHFTFINHPWLFVSLIIAGLGVATLLGYGIYKIIKLKKTTNNFIKSNLKRKKPELSPVLKSLARSLNLEKKIVEINDTALVVFCYGIFRPKICISSAFAEKLSTTELKAVLLHEQHHLRIYDPIRLFILSAITKLFFFIPGLKALAKKYFMYSELAADEWAITNSKDKTPLARAVYKVLQWQEEKTIRDGLSVPFFNTVTEARVNKITGNTAPIKINLLSPKFLISTGFLFFFILSFSIFLYSSNAAIANHNNGVCLSDHGDSGSGCEMLSDESECQMDGLENPLENSVCEPIIHTDGF